jgi:hypothetical protein
MKAVKDFGEGWEMQKGLPAVPLKILCGKTAGNTLAIHLSSI